MSKPRTQRTPTIEEIADLEVELEPVSADPQFFTPVRCVDDDGDSIHLKVVKTNTASLGGHYVRVMKEGFRVLREAQLPGSGANVLFWLGEHIDSGNLVVGLNQREVARECGMQPCQVSYALKRLEAHNLVRRAGRGCLRFNPRFCYYGTTEEQQRACKQWDREQAELNQRANVTVMQPARA